MKKVTETELQALCEEFVRNNQFVNQSHLVSDALDQNFFEWSDLEGLDIYRFSDIDGNVVELTKEQYEDYLAQLKQSINAAEIDDNDPEDILMYKQHLDYITWLSPESQEIYEWWLVEDHIARELLIQGEPILQNNYGIWWGRTCSGQAISMDTPIQKIVAKVKEVQYL